ncbi:centromere protein C isoform X2 [Hippopotamus amphibius kiboko]|uniref:centromere protein C isoform X2 n=1 Tax=Hippopotamus amphibius kiboko TaxID=575201 RepID=UPI00259205A0|nr:centromere protein C isoform X2 [Hippopotamus amphibius kiboko]
MAAWGLDHLKNDYRRRFCRPPRVPDINTEQGQNILEILLDCFEEKSIANDFSANSTKPVLYSTPKTKTVCIQSPSKETQCQKSRPKSGPVSSRKKEAPLQLIVEPSEAVNKSVQAHEVHQKTLATDVRSENTSDLREMSSKNQKDHHSEADEEFYLSVGSPSDLLDAKARLLQKAIPSVAQKGETYTSENSVNMLSSSTEISHKTKKRLNFEDKDVLKKVEITNKVSETEDKVSETEDKVSEGPQERKQLGTSQKRTQDSECENQPQARKSFSTLFLETVKRKSESSSVVRHITPAPSHSSPANNMKLLEDEFIIDESDKSFASQPWITIPRKTGPLKQHTVSPAESTVQLQRRKSREKHDSVSSTTLTSNRHPGKAHPIEKSQPSEQKILGGSCGLTNETENNCKSAKHEMYSENAKKSSVNKRTIKQKRGTKFKASVVEEQVDMEQSKDKNINISHIAQDRLQRNSDRNMEEGEEISIHISPKQLLPVGSKKGSTNVPQTESQKKDKECKKKHYSEGSKKNKIVPEELTSTVTRSRRISRRPSNWWVVKSEQSLFSSNSAIRNELSLHHNSRQKPEKKNQSSKNIGEKTIPFKRQKRANEGSSRTQKVLNAKDSGCSQNESLESNEADLAKKTNLNPSGGTGSSKNQDSMATQNVRQKSQISGYTCKTPAESNLDAGEPGTSVLEGSGPSRLKNYLTSGMNNSDVDDNEIQESSNDSRVKRLNLTPEKKMHHKLILPSNTPDVRRTMRTRSKPLEYWRGERIDYQGRPSGGFVIGGILSPSTVSSKRKAKGNLERVNTIVNRKRICLDDDERKNKFMVNLNIPLGDPLQPTRVKDPETREIILMDLIRPRGTYQFCVEHGELKVYKTLDTPFFSTGKLILGPHQEKGKQHVGLDTLIYAQEWNCWIMW